MAAHQAPPSLGFSRHEHWNGLPFPSWVIQQIPIGYLFYIWYCKFLFVFLKKKDYDMWSTVDRTFNELITWVWLPDKVENELELPVTAGGGGFHRNILLWRKDFIFEWNWKLVKYMLILMVSLSFIILRINHCWCVCLKKFISVFHPGPRETI